MVCRIERRHRRHERDACATRPAVEPGAEQDWLAGNLRKPPRWNIDPRFPRKLQQNGLPDGDRPVVVPLGELRDQQPLVRVPDRRLGPRAPKRCARRKDKNQVLVRLLVALDAVGANNNRGSAVSGGTGSAVVVRNGPSSFSLKRSAPMRALPNSSCSAALIDWIEQLCSHST
jgi:hypothetical protein